MVNDRRDVLCVAWWVSTMPGLAFLVLVVSINLLGERLREVLNPRRRRA